MNFVTLLIQATALMATLIILRPLLKRFVSPRARCALWAIPALRLLLPFEIKSQLSIMAPAEPVSESLTAAISQPTGLEAPSWLGSGIGVNGIGVHTVTDDIRNGLDPVSTHAPSLSVESIILLFWLIGAAVTAGIIIYQNVKFARSAKLHSEYMGDGFGLPLYLLHALPSPCLAGIFKPKIFINRQTLLSDEVLEMTIRHEMTHYKRLDHVWGALRGVLLALYWFHPLVWYCSELFRADCETACDAAATKGMNEEEKQSYGMALISLASRIPRGSTGRLVCLSTMNGGKKLLKERITLLASTRTLRCAAVIAIAVAAVLCFTMCTTPAEEAQTPTPPSPTPGFMGEEPSLAEKEPIATTEPVPTPAMGEEGSLEDLAYFMELCVPDVNFQYMSFYDFEPILEEYGDLLNNFKLTYRESEDGKYAYIAGMYEGEAEANPFLPLYSVEIGYSNTDSTVQVLYTEEQQEWVERSMTEANLPKDVITLHNSRIYWHPESNLIIIEPSDVENSLTVGYSRYLQGQRAYIADAAQRGIALIRPEGPHLEIYMISEKWGEVTEWIPLTELEAEAILAEDKTEILPGFGFSATIRYRDIDELYNENRGIPQSVLDLAVEKCDYRFGDPGMINAPITEAKLECSWLNAPIYADEADLSRLESILKNAQFGYVGACGYGAKLTVRMGNEMVTMFKGTDGCDTIVFGSYSGYFLGDAENTEFWSIFDLDYDSKMPKAPEILMTSSDGTVQLSGADAQYVYDAINTGKRYETSPACACDYSLTVGDTRYIYHSDCGTFIKTDDNSCICVDEHTMDSVNAILSQYRTR